MHGGLIGSYRGGADICYGFVPGQRKRLLEPRRWVAALNAWARQQVAEWIESPHWREVGRDEAEASTRVRGGNALMAYVAPGSEPSVVMGRHLNEAGMPKALPSSVVSYLWRGGISRLVLGHTPHGNCPTVIKQTCEMAHEGADAAERGGLSREASRDWPGRLSRGASNNDVEGGGARCFEVIMADTSFSDMTAPDRRGAAVSEVQVLQTGAVRVHGMLHDGCPIDYTLAASPAYSGAASSSLVAGSSLVGMHEPEGAEPRVLLPFTSHRN